MTWPQLIFPLLGGFLIGVVAMHLWGARDVKHAKKLEKKIHQLQHKHHAYQEQVTQHFARSAELVNNLTHQYQVVYAHLANGAKNLCQEGPSLPNITVDKLHYETTQTQSEQSLLGDPMANLVQSNVIPPKSITVGDVQAPKDYPQDVPPTIKL